MIKLKNILATGLVALPVLLGMPGCRNPEGSESNAPKTEQVQKENQAQETDELRGAVLSYLATPKFSNSDFMKQLTGTSARLEMFDLREDRVYLSIPAGEYKKDMFGKLTLNPSAVEFAKTEDGQFDGSRTVLGDYIFRMPGKYVFGFPSADFKIDASSVISVSYPSATYSMSLRELNDFVDNASIYGGCLEAYTGVVNVSGEHEVIANHGAFVAKKGEKSLERLVTSLTKGKTSEEEKTQRLLDFVTEETVYNHSEANAGVEVLKRPNEVLMTGGSDCSGKAILFASLLEQIGTDYRLVYTDNHITLGVPGNFPKNNGMSFKIGGKTYYVAEPTAKGFEIGTSELSKRIGVENIRYFQKPGKGSAIYDAKTGKELPFR